MTTKLTNKPTATTSPTRATKKSAKKVVTKKATKKDINKSDFNDDFNWRFSDWSKTSPAKPARSDGSELRIFANVTVNDKDGSGYGKNVEFSIETDSLENLKLELATIYTQIEAF